MYSPLFGTSGWDETNGSARVLEQAGSRQCGGARPATFDRPGGTVLLRGYDGGGRVVAALHRARRGGEGSPERRDRSNSESGRSIAIAVSRGIRHLPAGGAVPDLADGHTRPNCPRTAQA